MVQEINWSIRAHVTFQNEFKYLEDNFSDVEMSRFARKIDEKLFLLKSNPRLGSKVGQKRNIYKTGLNKRVDLYYHYKPLKKEIILLAFWNTLQNPKKLKLK
jgi:plasmid stabilization system protein ParE